jgi:hypothetical protein
MVNNLKRILSGQEIIWKDAVMAYLKVNATIRFETSLVGEIRTGDFSHTIRVDKS